MTMLTMFMDKCQKNKKQTHDEMISLIIIKILVSSNYKHSEQISLSSNDIWITWFHRFGIHFSWRAVTSCLSQVVWLKYLHCNRAIPIDLVGQWLVNKINISSPSYSQEVLVLWAEIFYRDKRNPWAFLKIFFDFPFTRSKYCIKGARKKGSLVDDPRSKVGRKNRISSLLNMNHYTKGVWKISCTNQKVHPTLCPHCLVIWSNFENYGGPKSFQHSS